MRMIHICMSRTVILVLTLLYAASAASLNGFVNEASDDQAIKHVGDSVRRRLGDALNKIDELITEHIVRQLQQLPPPFVPTRACGETIGEVSVAEIQALSNIYITALFEGSGDPGLAGLATTTLLGQLVYDLRLVKVCMSCAEAEAVLPADIVSNAADAFGFQNFCGDGMYGVGERESSIAFIPVDPETKSIVSGTMRALIYGRGTTIPLGDCPSEIIPANWTQYLIETEINDVLARQVHTLVPAIFGGTGAVAIMPDFLGYGESYQVDRPYFAKQLYARSYALAWLAARQYVRDATMGCSDLEPVVTSTGFSEGGYAAVVGGLGLQAIGVRIRAAFPGGSPFQLSKQVTFSLAKFADGAPPIPEGELFVQQALIAYFSYAFSNEFPFFSNTGTGQRAFADAYLQGDITTNGLLWFKSPAQIGLGFLAFVPENPTEMINPIIAALNEDAVAIGSEDMCADFDVAGVDRLCATIIGTSLLPELENLVDFPTEVCHSPDDELVTIRNAPTFPFVNPFVTEYTGIPVLNILEPQGGHGVSAVLCAISPVLSLQVQGDDFPAKIAPLENPPAECLAAMDDVSSAPTPAATATQPTPAPSTPATPTTKEPTMAPEPGSAASVSRLTVTTVLSFFFAVVAL